MLKFPFVESLSHKRAKVGVETRSPEDNKDDLETLKEKLSVLHNEHNEIVTFFWKRQDGLDHSPLSEKEEQRLQKTRAKLFQQITQLKTEIETITKKRFGDCRESPSLFEPHNKSYPSMKA